MTDITSLIKDTSLLNESTLPELQKIVEEYPFYHTARLLYIHNLFALHHKDFGAELRKASILIADRTALFSLVESMHYQIQCHPDRFATEPASIETESDNSRTISLIDSFLLQSKGDAEGQVPSIADLTNDYASFLIKSEDAEQSEGKEPKLKGADLIDSFIENTRGKQRFEMPDLPDDYNLEGIDETTATEFQSPHISHEDEEIYTENMVNIYIAQGRYKQALEILRKICLNNPKKNSNFAAQIKLLETVIANIH